MKSAFLSVLCACSIALLGCAKNPRPILYPNETYRQVGAATAQEEASHCMELADEQGLPKDRQAGEAARKGARGSMIGAIVWGAVGWIWGRPGRGAAAGAVRGGATGAIGGYEGSGAADGTFQKFVQICMREKGFQVIGWK